MRLDNGLVIWCWDEVGAFTDEIQRTPSDFKISIAESRDVVVAPGVGQSIYLHGGTLKIGDLTIRHEFEANGDGFVICTFLSESLISEPHLLIRAFATSFGVVEAGNTVPDHIYDVVTKKLWQCGLRTPLQKSAVI